MWGGDYVRVRGEPRRERLGDLALLFRARHSHGRFLFTISSSLPHQTPDIVRQMPAVSPGGNPA
jgi:hypothetical protein